MPKYIIQKTDILKDKKIHPEGSEIELKEEEAKVLADFLISIEKKKTAKNTDDKVSKPKAASTNHTSENTSAKTEDKTSTETKDKAKTENKKADGGSK